MRIVADLHFHSKYSRAVSPEMMLPKIVEWANKKGIDLVTTTDFTHPLWLRELRANLVEVGDGIYALKSERVKGQESKKGGFGPKFIFTTEISSIYTQLGKLRRIHLLVMAPNMEEAGKIEEQFAMRGNVMSDGRPIFELSAKDIAELVFTVSPKALVIPAHAWNPNLSLYGSESGFNSMTECFGNLAKNIYAVETGLSSDPRMNWQIGELDNRSLISCSDAHSGAKLGREVTVFQEKSYVTEQNRINKVLSYDDIAGAIKRSPEADWKIGHTIEFYPEEGKYHFTGHRNCNVKQSPEQTKKLGTVCPVCGRGLTVGIMHRVEELATRVISNQELVISNDEFGVKWIGYKDRPPYATLVPLLEIIAETFGIGVSSQKTREEYNKLTTVLGGEFNVLLTTPVEGITRLSGPRIAEAIMKVRSGDIIVEPGYDGILGTVNIWNHQEESDKSDGSILDKPKSQLNLF